ncbi:neural cell adhesion molecule 1-like [Montipora capricornis]|uniref:neural cell adhesion molecule 1-like n=1 Tax=Montipora capricornis TaxID=246305 RepID=UPI0035F189E7
MASNKTNKADDETSYQTTWGPRIKPPRFKDEKPKQPLIYGKPGKIRCTAEGNPPPQFEWKKNDSLLLEKDIFIQLSDGSLQIDKVGREDKGAYKCSIKQTKGSERTTVYSQVTNVSVIVPLKVQLSRTLHNSLEGDNITLNCTVVDGLPKPQISWFKDKLPLTEEKATLVKSYVTEEGEGTYTCVAKNEGGAANGSIYIVVDAPPKLDAALKESLAVLYQSTLELKCIQRGEPQPNVTWTKNGTQVANNNILVITNVTFKDAGQYGCIAKNRAGNVSCKIWIHVIAAPVVYVSPQSQSVVEGETTNISCKASGVPRPKLSWKFANGELPSDVVIINTSHQSLLQLPNTAKSMEGWYQCKAKNEAGEEYSNSSLHVLGFGPARTKFRNILNRFKCIGELTEIGTEDDVWLIGTMHVEDGIRVVIEDLLTQEFQCLVQPYTCRADCKCLNEHIGVDIEILHDAQSPPHMLAIALPCRTH